MHNFVHWSCIFRESLTYWYIIYYMYMFVSEGSRWKCLPQVKFVQFFDQSREIYTYKALNYKHLSRSHKVSQCNTKHDKVTVASRTLGVSLLLLIILCNSKVIAG